MYKDVFPPGQPFKSLYAVHALIKFTRPVVPGHINRDGSLNDTFVPYPVLNSKALETAISLVVHAISDKNVLEKASPFMRLKLTSSLLQAYKQFHDSMCEISIMVYCS